MGEAEGKKSRHPKKSAVEALIDAPFEKFFGFGARIHSHKCASLP